jgi:outer membrane protein insertion porin family
VLSVLLSLLAATPSPTCAVDTDSGARLELSVVADAPLGDWPEREALCAELGHLVGLPAVPTTTTASIAARLLVETTYFRTATCTPDGRTLACVARPGTLVAQGEVDGSLPFVLLRSDVDRRLSLRAGVPLEGELGPEGTGQAARLARYLVREGYFGSTATAAWTMRGGAEPMQAAELTVSIDVGPATTLGHVVVRGDTGALSPEEAREHLVRYWLLSFVERRFRPLDFEDDLEALTDVLRERGFPEAVVRGRYLVDADTDTVDVVLDVDAGARLELSFQGNLALDDDALAAAATFAEARSLDAEEIDNTAEAIRRLYQREGYFEVEVDSRLLDRPRPTLGVHYTVREGRRAWLADVTLTGTTALPPAQLAERAALRTRTRAWPLRSGAWVDTWVEQDLKALAEVLKAEGYGAPAVSAEVEIRQGGELAARFVLDAGPRRTVGKLELRGLPTQIDGEALAAALALRPGQPYVAAAQTPDRRALLDALAAAGYPGADVARKMRLPMASEPGEVSLTYTVEPGPRAFLGGVLVRGNLGTARALIEDNLMLELGEPLGARAVADARRRLSALGVFGAVELETVGLWRADSPTWLLVSVEERARRDLFVVLSFSTDDYFAAGVDFVDRNLFGRALSLDLQLRLANASQVGTDVRIGLRDRVLLRLVAPRPFSAPFDVELRAYYDFVARPDTFDERRVGASVALSRVLVDRSACALCPSVVAGVGYELAATSLVVRVAPEDLAELGEPEATIGRVFARLSADRRDSVIDPRSGYLAELRLELANRQLAQPFAADAYDFWRLLPTARGYLELGAPLEARLDEGQIIGGPFVLAGSLGYGLARAYGESTVVPQSESFAYGGDQSVRGLGDGASRLGFVAPTYLLYGSVELRYYALQNFGFGTIQLAGFTDLGAVGAHLGELLDDPTVSVGAALRYVTPIGPLSVAYGWPVVRSEAIVAARTPELDPIPARGRFHLSFGTSF